MDVGYGHIADGILAKRRFETPLVVALLRGDRAVAETAMGSGNRMKHRRINRLAKPRSPAALGGQVPGRTEQIPPPFNISQELDV